MKRHLKQPVAGMTLGWVLAGTLIAGVTFAQGPDGPPPPFGGPGGGPPPFGRFGGGPPPPLTVANVPLALLDARLKLTAPQDNQIEHILSDLLLRRQALRPDRGQRPEGPPPDRDPMQAMQDKARAMDTEASDKIGALLTADQRRSIPGVLAEIDALRADGIPLQVYGDLKLSADQEKQLTAIGTAADQARKQAMDNARASGGAPPRDAMRQARQQTDDKVASVLTAAQRQTLDTFRQAHPRRGPGGPGGPGFGGPPPPDGMGPPPPDSAGPPPPGY